MQLLLRLDHDYNYLCAPWRSANDGWWVTTADLSTRSHPTESIEDIDFDFDGSQLYVLTQMAVRVSPLLSC
jgi:hypothetical protein